MMATRLKDRFKELYERIRKGAYTYEDLDEAIKVGKELIKIHEKEGNLVDNILMRIIVKSLELMKNQKSRRR